MTFGFQPPHEIGDADQDSADVYGIFNGMAGKWLGVCAETVSGRAAYAAPLNGRTGADFPVLAGRVALRRCLAGRLTPRR